MNTLCYTVYSRNPTHLYIRSIRQPNVTRKVTGKVTGSICHKMGSNIIRFWNSDTYSCLHALERKHGGGRQIRFQPQDGTFLATALQKIVLIMDVETNRSVFVLDGNDTNVLSVSWEKNGEYVAYVTQDFVKLWSLGTKDCIHVRSSNGENKFHSSVFHPSFTKLLIIGGYKSYELWNWDENKVMKLLAHECFFSALSDSPSRGIITSARYDESIKIWK